MNDIDSDFDQLIRRVRDGSQDAAWELIQNFTSQILRVVRRRLPNNLRRQFDSRDFVQAAWASFFAHPSLLHRCETPNEFAAFLGGIAANKVKMEVRRRFYVKKYDIRRERSLNDSTTGGIATLPATQATPSQCAIARERWLQLLDCQPDHYRQIANMRISGMKILEIAEELELNEGTVRRALDKMIEQLYR